MGKPKLFDTLLTKSWLISFNSADLHCLLVSIIFNVIETKPIIFQTEEVMADTKEQQMSASTEGEEISPQQLEEVVGGSGKPPSGDSNPGDLTNPTVDTSDIINPQPS